MFNLILFADALEVLPFVIVPLVVCVVFAAVTVTAVKRVRAEKRRQNEEAQKRSVFTDGNGRTEAQNRYLAEKRRQMAQRKIELGDESHTHTGVRIEQYDKIVGSLGEVNDEGCDDTDGVRLIDHDESYCDDPDHFAADDTDELRRAIVLGEVLNSPRYKNAHRRK